MLNDDELDKLLAQAAEPDPPEGFEKRMMARLNATSASNVIAFPQRKSVNPWLVGLPLAASLMLGIWLGASSRFDNLIPTNDTIFAANDGAGDGDTDDFDSVIEDQQS
jgi:hypothetical protein